MRIFSDLLHHVGHGALYVYKHTYLYFYIYRNHWVAVHGVWPYFIWFKNQTSTLPVFPFSLLTIFIWLQWTCLSQTFLYIPVRSLCVGVRSDPGSSACPAPCKAEFAGGICRTMFRGRGQLTLLPSKSSCTGPVRCHRTELLGETPGPAVWL